MSLLKTLSVKIVLPSMILFFLGWFISSQYGLSKDDLLRAVDKFGLTAIGCALLWVALQNFFMGLRVWCLFPKNHRVRFFSVMHAVFYGQALNTFVPARAGDVFKVVSLSKSPLPGQEINMITSAGVLVADKIIDIFSLVLLIIGSRAFFSSELLVVPPIPNWVYVVLPVVAVSIVLLFQGFLKTKWARIKDGWFKFKAGLSGVFEPTKAVFAIAIGICAWSSEAFTLQVLCQSQDFKITFSQAVFVCLF